jgi:GH25 family lysozyme M1 (1,4-beta-N-acetylmuramidase)
MSKQGVDISHYQGTPDFAKLAKKVDFVILQAGYGRYSYQVDNTFERNYAECKKYKIPVGVYWFSYAESPADAKTEAAACMEVIKGKRFEYPIYYDVESRALSGDIYGKCRAFCDELEKNGYFAGIYISRSPAQSYLPADVGDKYALWIADYNNKCYYSGSYGMWQNSSTWSVGGIATNVDHDYCYVDYPSMIKRLGLNGFAKPEPTEVLDTEGFKKGDKELGVLMYKQLLILARSKGLIKQSVKSDSGFGDGTEKATNELLKSLGYEQNGIAGENLAKKLGVIL